MAILAIKNIAMDSGCLSRFAILESQQVWPFRVIHHLISKCWTLGLVIDLSMNSLIKRILVLVWIIVCSGCVNTIPPKRVFNYELKYCKNDTPAKELIVSAPRQLYENLDDCLIRDSLVFCLSNGNSTLFDILKLDTGERVGSFCHVGRAGEEVLSSLPLRSVYRNEAGELFADIFSIMDGKLMRWNISSSIHSGKDVYDKICFLSKDQFPPFTSILRVNGNKLVVFDAGVNAFASKLERIPDYREFDINAESFSRSYDLFKQINAKAENSHFPSIAYYNCVDCVNPKEDKLAIAMSFMPVISVIDVNSGKARGFKIKGERDFSAQEPRSCFVDVQADDKYIYALYSGKAIDFEHGLELPDILFVMDWDGSMIGKYQLGMPFSRIHLDGETLFFTHPDGVLCSIHVSDL